ncbi:chromate transporter [Peptoniphilus sp. GNH]|nr:chromate transport protein [Clostridiales bacterium KA00134]UHR02361.1 chromate transporter [Peptoniphilus sp. GNH]
MFDLFFVFLKIGALAFGGGYAVLSLIIYYVIDVKAWLMTSELMDLVSISQMTPGPIAINSATFVGQKVDGFIGSILATLGVTLPQFILMMILGYFLFSKGKKFKILDWILMGIKSGVVSLILISAISLFKSSVFDGDICLQNISPVAASCFILGLVLYIKKISLFKLIALGAVLGILLSTFLK